MNRRRLILGMAAVAAVAATPALATINNELPFSELPQFWKMRSKAIQKLADFEWNVDAFKDQIYDWLRQRNATLPVTFKGINPVTDEYAEVTFHRLVIQHESHGHRVLSIEVSTPFWIENTPFLQPMAWGK